MAWSVLQSASAQGTSGNASVTFTTQNLTSGSKVLAWVSVSGGTVSAVKDGALNSWTLMKSFTGASNPFVYLYALDTPAGDAGTKPTITATISSNFGWAILVEEVTGLLAGNTTAMLDGSGATNSGAASSGPATSGTYSSTAANELLVFGAGDDGNSITFGTPSSSYTPDAHSINGSGNASLEVGYKNSSSGPESGSSTITGATDWATILVAFKLTAAGPAAGPVFYPAVQAIRVKPPVAQAYRSGLIYANSVQQVP